MGKGTFMKINGIGALQDCTVELKPLTLFIGKNNIGKSYYALVIHSINQSIITFRNRHLYPPIQRVRSFRGLHTRSNFLDYISKHRDEILECYNNINEILNKEKEVEVPKKLHDKLILRVIEYCNDSLSEIIKEDLMYIFGRDLSSICNDFSEEFNVLYSKKMFEINIHYIEGELGVEVTIKKDPKKIIFFRPPEGISWTTSFTSDKDGKVGISINPGPFSAGNRHVPDDLILEMFFEGCLCSCLDIQMINPTYYLPAARSGIISARKLLAYALIKTSNIVGFTDLKIERMNGVNVDFLANLQLIESKIQNKKFNKIISMFEKNILFGEIDLKRETDEQVPEIIYRYRDKELPLCLSSSMVSELAPLILYIKNVIPEDGSTLIIEEPESHLHPAAQKILTRAIVMMVNSGINVILTTHSDILVQQLHNLIKLHGNKKLQKEFEYTEDETIAIQNVSSYLFYPLENFQTRVKPIDMMDSTLSDVGFSEVYKQLYDEMVFLDLEDEEE
ncbi:MAG: AAA family ATPase [Candidatus Helarchaeota archaeon]